MGTHNFSESLCCAGGLNSEKKQLIDKSIDFCIMDGEKTRAGAIAYQTLHHPAQTVHVMTKLLVNTFSSRPYPKFV